MKHCITKNHLEELTVLGEANTTYTTFWKNSHQQRTKWAPPWAMCFSQNPLGSSHPLFAMPNHPLLHVRWGVNPQRRNDLSVDRVPRVTEPCHSKLARHSDLCCAYGLHLPPTDALWQRKTRRMKDQFRDGLRGSAERPWIWSDLQSTKGLRKNSSSIDGLAKPRMMPTT